MFINIKPKVKRIYEITVSTKHPATTSVRSIYHIINQFKKGFSPIIAVVGDKGIGKSFCACWVADTILKILGKPFDIEKNCAYNLDQAIDFIDQNNKNVLILDEMIELGYRREFYKKSHTHFVKILNTQRYKQIFYILIIPFLSDLDRKIAKHVNTLFWVKKKGVYLAGRLPSKFYTFKDYEDDRVKWFEKIVVPKSSISKELWDQYEEFSITNKKMINDRINSEIRKESIFNKSDNKEDIAQKILDKLNDPRL